MLTSVARVVLLLTCMTSGSAQKVFADDGLSQSRPTGVPVRTDFLPAETATVQQALIREALSIPGRDFAIPNFVRMPSAAQGTGSDYLTISRAASKGRTFRFARMPISVYIDASAQPEMMSACLSALYMWEFRTHGFIRFVQTQTPEAARIQVFLRHHGFQPGGTPQGAVTHLDWYVKRNQPPGTYQNSGYNDDSPYFVPPQVIDINLDVSQDRESAIRPLLIKNITAHELGHALGLLGHSTVKSDLLYKDTDEYSRLSERDLNTLNRLYLQNVDIPL
jgi:hypothetical protein